MLPVLLLISYLYLKRSMCTVHGGLDATEGNLYAAFSGRWRGCGGVKSDEGMIVHIEIAGRLFGGP